jgi:hypothetical protein
MTYQQAEDRSRIRRQRSELAIRLAMQSRWEEAVQTNRSILAMFPDDVDAWNRLGKALTELGRYADAREAYGRALNEDPANSIAKKNLDRLAKLGDGESGPVTQKAVDPQLFIEETGKSGQTVLQRTDPKVLARATAGDAVELRRQDSHLLVENAAGEYLGEVEPRLALRLAKLMDGGNRYAAAVTSIEDSTARIIIKEVFQHPSQRGRPSFPTTLGEGVRPYTKDTLLRYGPDDEDDEVYDEIVENVDDWEESPDAEPASAIRLADVEAAEASDDDEFEE